MFHKMKTAVIHPQEVEVRIIIGMLLKEELQILLQSENCFLRMTLKKR